MQSISKLCSMPRAKAVCHRLLAAASIIYIGGAQSAHAQVAETVLYTFTGGADGLSPYGPPLLDQTGPSGAVRGVYGTAIAGGIDNCSPIGCGTVFKLTPPERQGNAWTETTLWDFTGGAGGGNPSDGVFSLTKRIWDKTPLYGTTQVLGGAPGYGTVFSVIGKSLTAIYTFTGGADGEYPEHANVVGDGTGALYTTASEGGTKLGCGTVIKLTPPAPGQTTWAETTIWTFNNVTFDNGCAPGGLVFGPDGALYGPTQYGDFADGYNGSIFRLAPPANGGTQWTEQNLYYFTSADHGSQPLDKLTFGKGGSLYGTVYSGGEMGEGVIFEIKLPYNGKRALPGHTIWNFTGGNDGGDPDGSVLVDRTGTVYGTASFGGAGGQGTVFKLTPPGKGQSAWTETTLWSFSNDSNGGEPFGLSADRAGTLYGFAGSGGLHNAGVVFSLTGTGYVP